MAKFLANENVPGEAVEAAREAGFDMLRVQDFMPGADDESVLSTSVSQGRVLVTFDKDFGELAFKRGKTASCGVILLRPRLQSPDYLSQFLLTVLHGSIDWEGHFSVAQEGNVRVLRLSD